jgi:hypothetical protein
MSGRKRKWKGMLTYPILDAGHKTRQFISSFLFLKRGILKGQSHRPSLAKKSTWLDRGELEEESWMVFQFFCYTSIFK